MVRKSKPTQLVLSLHLSSQAAKEVVGPPPGSAVNTFSQPQKVVGGSNMSEVASFSKIEIRAEGERIVTQGEPLESCWILLAGKAALSVWEDEETDFRFNTTNIVLYTEVFDLPTCLSKP